MTAALLRPEPILRHKARPVDAGTPARAAAQRLRGGETLIVTDRYGTGEEILAELRRLVPAPAPGAPYDQRQAQKRALREASLRLLAPIRDHALALAGARPIGFLRELYPEASFALPYVEVQELFGAWGRYEEGVHLAVLGHRLHPYYGTYAPTRTSHLELFATWLRAFGGARGRAVDVGTGSGVLAFLLAKAGFERVLATDSNPNAVHSLTLDLARRDPRPPITPLLGDLFAGDRDQSDLIAFNPPWTRGEVQSPLDAALYFDDGLFERFFAESRARLRPEGRIVLLFSNIIELVQPDVVHPIEAELARGALRLVQKLQRRVDPEPGPDGHRRRTRERVEVWELALA